MSLITWDDSYSVQIKSIDEQHKKLVDIINEMHNAMLNRKSKEVLGEILKGIIDYTEYHFKYEESLMEKAGYTNLEEHKKIHNEFVEQVKDFYNRHQKQELFLSVEISEFLIKWLIKHIKGTDRLYIKTMKDKGID